MSLILGNYTAEKLAKEGKPNDYVLLSSERGWPLLDQLMHGQIGIKLGQLFDRRDWPIDPMTLKFQS